MKIEKKKSSVDIKLILLFLLVNIIAYVVYELRLDDIPSEMYIFIYLVSHGHIPVKDFFENHSFLIYYLLYPIGLSNIFITLKIFYAILLTFNLFMFMMIIKRQLSKGKFVLSTWFYIVTSTFIGFSAIWYESIIASGFLAIYFFLIKHNIKHRILIISLISGLVTIIKPTAAIIFLPIIIFTGNIFAVFPSIILWGSTLLYLFTQHAIPDLVNGFITFNGDLVKYNPREPFQNFLFTLPPLSIAIFGLLSIPRKYFRNLFPLAVFLICCTVFLVNSTDRRHFVPVVVFFSLLISYLFTYIKRPILLKIFSMLIIFYCTTVSFLFINKISPFSLIHKKPPFIYPIRKLIGDPFQGKTRALSLKNKIGKKNILVLEGSDAIETYYYLNKIPPTYYPMFYPYPFLLAVKKDYETRTIFGIQKNNVSFILIQKPFIPLSIQLPKINKYINANFRLDTSNADYDLYEKI